MSKKLWILPVLVLFILSLACSAATKGAQKVGEVEQPSPTQAAVAENTAAVEKAAEAPTSAPTKTAAPVPTQAPEAVKPSSFQVGDIIETSSLRVVLTSAAYADGMIKANFSLENTGAEVAAVSSVMSFSAKDSEGTLLDQEIFDCGASLDGKILPGDLLRGDVCYKMASPGPFNLYFEAELFSSETVVWKLDASQLPQALAEVDVQPSGSKAGAAHAVMEPVKSDSETVTLTSAAYANGLLSANFLVENTGKEEFNLSSMMSFYVKDGSGVKLEQEYSGCGPAIDGKVLVGDRLRGDVCWKLPQAEKVKVYYESDLFSGGAVVWEVDPGQLPAALEIAPIPPSAGLQLQAKVYQAGEPAPVEGQIVTLNSAAVSGSILKANFTVENKGSEEFTVSSLMSFYARDPQGMRLESEYFDCGSSLDGKVLPADKLKGDVCWQTGGASEFTLYYEASMLGKGAAVWKVK